MPIPQRIKQLANDIRTKIKGKEVRESLAKGIEEAGNIADSAEKVSLDAKQIMEIHKKQFDEAIKRGDQVVEVQTLRVDPLTGKIYTTAADRFEANQREVDLKLQETGYYDEISYEKYRDEYSETDYYITHIPHLDSTGKLIELKHGYQNDLMNSGNGETTRSFANRHTASLAINASTWDSGTGLIWGIQIQDGEVLQNSPHDRFYTLGIREDNTLMAYPPQTSAQSILDDGCINAVTGFYPMIQNGIPLQPFAGLDDKQPRQVIAQLPNKDIIVLTVEGRSAFNAGMNWDDCIRILTEKGVIFAYMLDGGGSTSTVVRGIMINNPIDDEGLSERKVSDFLYIKKDVSYPDKYKTVNQDLGELGNRISILRAELKNLREFYLAIKLKGPGTPYNGIESWQNDKRQSKLYLRKDQLAYYSYLTDDMFFRVLEEGDLITNKLRVTKDFRVTEDGVFTPDGFLGDFFRFTKTITNVNNINKTGIYWSLANATGAPNSDNSWAYLHIQQSAGDALQLAIPFSNETGELNLRRTRTNGWGPWAPLTNRFG